MTLLNADDEKGGSPAALRVVPCSALGYSHSLTLQT